MSARHDEVRGHAGHDHGRDHGHGDAHGHDHAPGGHSHAGHSHAGHGHAGHSHHHAPPDRLTTAFAVGILLNIAFVVIGVIAGLVAHSTALLADSAHNLGDVLGL